MPGGNVMPFPTLNTITVTSCPISCKRRMYVHIRVSSPPLYNNRVCIKAMRKTSSRKNPLSIFAPALPG